MKKVLTIIIALILTTALYAQNEYKDLLIIRADGDWEKLVKKSESYTLKSKTRKDPEPYYYLAYGLYKISFQGDRDEKYKNAYKDALNAIGKLVRFDQGGRVQDEHEDFIKELKNTLMEMIENNVDADQPQQAFGWAMRLYKFGRDYTPAYFMDGALRYARQDRTTARQKWQQGEDMLKDENVSNWKEADQEMLMMGIYLSAKYLKDDMQDSEAKRFMDMGAPYFEGNEDWDYHYDEIVN